MSFLEYLTGGKWADIEIWSLRAGEGIRVSKDKVQRRKYKDGAQYYYIKGTKDELEPQEFKNIYVGTKGEEVLKVFSPTKGVYLPIKFIYKKMRAFNDKEIKYINDVDYTDEEKKQLKEAKDEKEKKKLKQKFDTRIEREKKRRTKETYKKIYKLSFESQLDSDTLNHAIYKIQKNALRFHGGGMDMATKLTILMVMIVVVFIIMSWATYNYFIKPGMDFWNANSKDVITAKELDLETARVRAGVETPAKPIAPTPVG